jgi:signal transduction histidine kinase
VSLRRQFVLVFVAFSAVLSALGGGLAYRTAAGTLERELDDKVWQVAAAAAEVGLDAAVLLTAEPGTETEPFGPYGSVQERLKRLRRLFVDKAYVLKSDLTALVTTLPAETHPIGGTLRELVAFRADIEEALAVGHATSPLLFDETEGRWYKYGFVQLEQSDAVLAVLMPADFKAPLDDFRRTVVLGSVLASVVAALIAWTLATTVTQPLNRLGRVALRIQRGRMDEPVREERGGELGRLSRAMERMREGILHRDEQLRLMLAQVAHEIRNPLGGLELFASAAAETEHPQERRDFIKKVRSEITALNQIIDDFLAFARPVRSEGPLHDMRDPVREAVELVEMETGGTGRFFTLELPTHPLMARADPEHVKRVTLNLVRNAAQAGTEVLVRCLPHRGEAVLSVSDDGPGISEKLRDRVFEPFVTDKEQGAGLGLAIVKRVVEANLGRVELVSEGRAVGDGAEFRVYFRGGEDFFPEEPED